MQMMEMFAIMPETVLARFNKWDQILAMPQPPEKHQISQMSWHLTRGLAFAAKGDSERAEGERQAIAKIVKLVPPESMYGMLNPASAVPALADHYLAGRIAEARHDDAAAIEHLTKAVAEEDKLNYDEPPTWWYSTREALGCALLKAGKPAEAEAVFRKELETSPRNGRALVGLLQSLKDQGKTYDAQWIEQQLKASWKNADTPITARDL